MAAIVTANWTKCLVRFRLFWMRSQGFIADRHISPHSGNAVADGR